MRKESEFKKIYLLHSNFIVRVQNKTMLQHKIGSAFAMKKVLALKRIVIKPNFTMNFTKEGQINLIIIMGQ